MTICLNMIVKDEAHIIERCLDSVLPLIDTFVIVDTGSTDNTAELILQWGERNGIEGLVFARKWENFGKNRTQAVQIAANYSDYLLTIDADDYLEIPQGFVLPEMDKDSYSVEIKYGDLNYTRQAIFRNDGTWRWEGVLHEYPTRNEEYTQGHLAGPKIIVTNDGARSQQDTIEKFAADAKVLLKEHLSNQDDPRTVFYLAQSYRDSQQYPLAFRYYARRVGMGGFDQEVFFSKFQMGVLAEFIDDFSDEEVIKYYLDAWAFRPSRVEPLVNLAGFLRKNGRFAEAMLYSAYAVSVPMSGDVLFVDGSAYTWKAIDEYSIAAYYCGLYDKSLNACRALLDSDYIPDHEKARIRENWQFAIDKVFPEDN